MVCMKTLVHWIFLNGKDKTKRNKDNKVEEKRKEESVPEIKVEKTKEKIYISHMDDLFLDVGEFVIEQNKCSAGSVMRNFKIGYFHIEKIME